jgi:hypothetical protein
MVLNNPSSKITTTPDIGRILPPKTSSHQEDVGGERDIEVGESGRTRPPHELARGPGAA